MSNMTIGPGGIPYYSWNVTGSGIEAANKPAATPSYAKPSGGSAIEKLLANYKSELAAANKRNEARYNQGMQLLGLAPQNDGRPEGYTGYYHPGGYAPGPTDPTAPGYMGIPAIGPDGRTYHTGYGNTPVGGGGGGGYVDPGVGRAGAAISKQDAVSRGIYNTSTALNNDAVAYSTAMNDMAMRNAQLNMAQQQQADSNRYRDAELADRQRARQLDWISSYDDVQPDLSPILQMIQQQGQGSTEGMVYGGGGGGGGGYGGGGFMDASQFGYQIPSVGLYSEPPKKKPSGPSLGQLRNANARKASPPGPAAAALQAGGAAASNAIGGAMSLAKKAFSYFI